MPTANGYNIGQDNSIVLIDSIQGRINFTIITDFDDKEMSKTTKVVPMNGPALQDEIPELWEFSFSIDRASSGVDDYFAARAATFYATGQLPSVTLYRYVTEVGTNTKSVWQYSKCSLKLGDGGKWAGGDVVKQKISGTASTKVRVS